MIKFFLILGNLFIAVLVILLHIVSTIDDPEIYKLTGIKTSDSDLHPWFFTIESILLLNIMFISCS